MIFHQDCLRADSNYRHIHPNCYTAVAADIVSAHKLIRDGKQPPCWAANLVLDDLTLLMIGIILYQIAVSSLWFQ